MTWPSGRNSCPILYLCWAESRLYGNLVTLEKLTDEEAVVSLQTHFFFLYKRSSHMRQWLPFEEYRTIFETIWQDRAANAGWHLDDRIQGPGVPAGRFPLPEEKLAAGARPARPKRARVVLNWPGSS